LKEQILYIRPKFDYWSAQAFDKIKAKMYGGGGETSNTSYKFGGGNWLYDLVLYYGISLSVAGEGKTVCDIQGDGWTLIINIEVSADIGQGPISFSDDEISFDLPSSYENEHYTTTIGTHFNQYTQSIFLDMGCQYSSSSLIVGPSASVIASLEVTDKMSSYWDAVQNIENEIATNCSFNTITFSTKTIFEDIALAAIFASIIYCIIGAAVAVAF